MVGVCAGETGVSVGVDAVRSGPVTPDGSSEPEAAGDAVAVAGTGVSVAVGASPDPVVVGVCAGETGVSVGVDAVRSGPVTPDGSSEPQAAKRRRKGQRKDKAQQGHVSCRVCSRHLCYLLSRLSGYRYTTPPGLSTTTKASKAGFPT